MSSGTPSRSSRNPRQWIETRGGRSVTVTDHPVRGERVEFLNEPDDPDTGPLTLKFYLEPGHEVGVHSHPLQTETITVNAGRIRATIDGEEQTLEIGDHVRIESGTPHGYESVDDDEAILSVSMTPAMAFKDFIIAEHALGPDDYPNDGLNLPYLGLVFRRYGPMIAPPTTGITLWIQVWLLYLIGRLKRLQIPDDPLPIRGED